MPYLGSEPAVGFASTTKQAFSGDASAVAFTLTRAASVATDLEVFVDNVQQEPTTAYSVSGTTLTFTAAPATGTGNIYVVHRQGGSSSTTIENIATDLSFKSDGTVLKFGADSDITLTHVADSGLNIKNINTADDKPIVLTLQTGETDMAANDVMGKIQFQAPDEGTGTDAILVAAAIQAVSEGDFSSSANATALQFMTGASEAAATKMTLSSGGNLTVTGVGTFASLDISGAIDVDGTTNLDVVDIDGAVNMATTALVTGVLTTTAATVFNGGFVSNDGSTITTADNTDTLTLQSTDADAVVGPVLSLKRDSSSPADNDALAYIKFVGENDADEEVQYVYMQANALDVTDGTEDGKLEIFSQVAGAGVSRIKMDSTEIAFNDSSVDLDFRVESNGNTEMFIVNGGTNRVGIGANPDYFFKVTGSAANDYITVIDNQSSTAPYVMRLLTTNAASDNNTRHFLQATDSSTARFVVQSDGDVQNHDNSYGAISDQRVKQNISDATSQWDDIKGLRVRKFKLKDDVRDYGDDAKFKLGLVAQEAEIVSANLIKETPANRGDVLSSSEFGTLYEEGDTIPDGQRVGDVKEHTAPVKGIKYSILYMKAVKALQEAMTRIETLEAKVAVLEG